MKLILFDIDGTILNSDGAGRTAVHAAVREYLQLPHDPPAIRFDGKTDPQIIRELFEAAGANGHDLDAAITEVGGRYVRHLERALAADAHEVRLLPGVSTLLDAVEARADAVLGLLTGNVVDGARLKLQAAGITFDRFRVGAFGSDHADRTALPPIAAERAAPHMGRRPHGDDIVIVGDTPADMTCGRALGARAIGVATGRYSAADLAAAGAWAVFPTFEDTHAVLDAVWG